MTTNRQCPKCKSDECECDPQVTFTSAEIEAWLSSDAPEGLQKHDDYFTVGRMMQSLLDENLELRRQLQVATSNDDEMNRLFDVGIAAANETYEPLTAGERLTAGDPVTCAMFVGMAAMILAANKEEFSR